MQHLVPFADRRQRCLLSVWGTLGIAVPVENGNLVWVLVLELKEFVFQDVFGLLTLKPVWSGGGTLYHLCKYFSKKKYLAQIDIGPPRRLILRDSLSAGY